MKQESGARQLSTLYIMKIMQMFNPSAECLSWAAVFLMTAEILEISPAAQVLAAEILVALVLALMPAQVPGFFLKKAWMSSRLTKFVRSVTTIPMIAIHWDVLRPFPTLESAEAGSGAASGADSGADSFSFSFAIFSR